MKETSEVKLFKVYGSKVLRLSVFLPGKNPLNQFQSISSSLNRAPIACCGKTKR